MSSNKKVRGFRFFFWVSASLFVLAAANWVFNFFIAISGSISYLLEIGVLILGILFVAAFLNAVYNGVPNVREILNGVLGLNTTQGVQENTIQRDSPGNRTSLQESDESQPKFDKEVELKKLDLVSEEIRNRYFTALGIYFALMIAMIAAAFDIGIRAGSGETVPVFTVIGLLIVFLITARLTFGTSKRYRKIFAQFQPLIKNIEDGKTNGDLNDILKKLRE